LNFDLCFTLAQLILAATDSTMALPNHLYSRGLMNGRHSDITVNAFGTRYALHRLLLDRAPFFCSALSEPWFESSAKEITLHPEDIDSNITQTAFELALKRIYGCHQIEEEDKDPISLFATGCWLEMSDLIEACINSILRQMSRSKLSPYIQFVTSNYYGKHGDRILSAAKAMLCREGYEMLLCEYDGISGEIVHEIISSDAFYVPGEWERWRLAKMIFNRRLKLRALEAGIVNRDGIVAKLPLSSRSFMALRSETIARGEAGLGIGNEKSNLNKWLEIYAHPDIAPLLTLLEEGIHYIHMSFEQLQKVKDKHDILGIPLISEAAISNALWMSMELRQRIVNAREGDIELGLAHEIEPPSVDTLQPENPKASAKSIGKKPEPEDDESEDDTDSETIEGVKKQRKFWIPIVDATYSMGCVTEPSTEASNPRARYSRMSSGLDAQDGQWNPDFAPPQGTSDSSSTPSVSNAPSPEVMYTHFPPFRFAAEFPPPKTLKENKRVYSNTVWYAGSLWNVYIQKKETSKNTQLGIYLHRERQVEGSEEDMSRLAQNLNINTVDERINSIERELLFRRQGSRRPMPDLRQFAPGDLAVSSDSTLVSRPSADLDTISGLFRPTAAIMKASEATQSASAQESRLNTSDAFSENERDDADDNFTRYKNPTMPPYVDSRSTIRTYFKIYTPSKGGRVLSVYESAPDKFNFSQSWGWKSSNLVVDDISEVGGERGSAKEPRLRFMVVIGKYF
jgi:hypothetical protein